MHGVSIIIPTKNDYEHIITLVKHIDSVMHESNLPYEVIFVDDHSIDLTQQIIQRLSSLYPIRLRIKKSLPGKIYSLREGITQAYYDTIAHITTKNYTPKLIPRMIDKINEGFDIVVAKREEKQHTKKESEKILYFFWGKLFHHLDLDFDSQLKVFRKEIIQRLTFAHSRPSSFWFGLLIRARNAGYKITSITFPFEKKFSDKNRNIFHIAWDISFCAIDLKFANTDVLPLPDGFLFQGKEFLHYSRIRLSESAFFSLSSQQKKLLLFTFCAFSLGIILNWQNTLIFFISLLTFLYFSDLLFNLYLIIQSFTKPSEIYITDESIHRTREWPTYSILCPLYKEKAVLTQFIQAIESLDYPRKKIQVILLLEEDDIDTLQKIAMLSLPATFEIHIPRHSIPKTKPKALNYGLQYARGEYCVVYDAEDIPDKDQLKKTVLAFEKSDNKITCIQAKLNFYNPFQNILTRVFTAEYSLWFDLVLTGLQSTHSPIPLGGTSNHFRTKELKKIRGWDSFNVTEDCDLGLRLATKGYETAIVNSTTLEEANSNFPNWFSQRGRWIKGYIQTYLVHTRNPIRFIQQNTYQQFLAFQLVIGGKVMSLFVNPLLWCITLLYFSLRPFVGIFIEKFFPGPVLYIGVFCLVFGNFLYLYYYMVGCAKRGQYALIKYAFLVPLYWLAMSISGWIAIYKIITEPHYWAKTHHGFHLQNRQSIFGRIKTAIAGLTPKPQFSL